MEISYTNHHTLLEHSLLSSVLIKKWFYSFLHNYLV